KKAAANAIPCSVALFTRCAVHNFLAISARLPVGVKRPYKRPSSTLLAPAGAFVPPAPFKSRTMANMNTLWMIVGCGVLAIVYGIWATQSVMSADPGSKKMQEISEAVREGAQAYLRRQYATIGVVGIVVFLIIGFTLGWLVAVGFAVGAILSGATGFIGMNVSVRANGRVAQAATTSLPGGVGLRLGRHGLHRHERCGARQRARGAGRHDVARRRAWARIQGRRHNRHAGRGSRAAWRHALFRVSHRRAAQ